MDLRRPPRLTVFLDYGGDLGGLPACALEGLAEAVIVNRRLGCPAENRVRGAYFRACVDKWVEGGPAAVSFFGEVDPAPVAQATVSAFAWAADCYDDAAVAERFERALPPDLYAEMIEWVCERRARAAT